MTGEDRIVNWTRGRAQSGPGRRHGGTRPPATYGHSFQLLLFSSHQHSVGGTKASIGLLAQGKVRTRVFGVLSRRSYRRATTAARSKRRVRRRPRPPALPYVTVRRHAGLIKLRGTKWEAASSRRGVTAPPSCCSGSIKTAVAATKQRRPVVASAVRQQPNAVAAFNPQQGLSRRGGSGFFVCRRGVLRIIAVFAETFKPHGFGTQAGHSVDESWSVGRCPGLPC